MVDGSAKVGEFTSCWSSGETAAIDQDGNKGVVEVACNYGASRTDNFLVAFKTWTVFLFKTDFVDIRKNSILDLPWFEPSCHRKNVY